MDEYTESRYNMILGKYILIFLGINNIFSQHINVVSIGSY